MKKILKGLDGLKIVGADIVEVSPRALLLYSLAVT
jgi:arginase family enzyme